MKTRFPTVPSVVSRREEARAGALLGLDHTLVRLLGLRRSLVQQVGVTTIALLVGIAGVLFTHTLIAPFELGATGIVGIVFGGGLLFVMRQLRSQAHELIASGNGVHGVRIVDNERRRLLSPSERERAACSLEALLRDSHTWGTVPAGRPLPELRCLRFLGAEILEISAILRSTPVNVAGVARTMRFLDGRADSVLLSGDVERVRHELNRIRMLLSTPHAADSDRVAA